MFITTLCCSSTDGKYHLTSSGHLRVFDTGPSDAASVFNCRTLDGLTGETKLSRGTRIIISSKLTLSSPTFKSVTIVVKILLHLIVIIYRKIDFHFTVTNSILESQRIQTCINKISANLL